MNTKETLHKEVGYSFDHSSGEYTLWVKPSTQTFTLKYPDGTEVLINYDSEKIYRQFLDGIKDGKLCLWIITNVEETGWYYHSLGGR